MAIKVVAHILEGGPTATLTLDTPEQVARYLWDHRDQAEKWDIDATPDEEIAINRELDFMRAEAS